MLQWLSISRALTPLVKKWIRYMKMGHPDPDSSAGKRLYSLIVAITLSALNACTYAHTDEVVRLNYRHDLTCLLLELMA